MFLVVVVGGGGWWVASYPLLSQAPTPVEVELGCDNYVLGGIHKFSFMYKKKFWSEKSIQEYHS
jgi:hypothetical protein